MSGVAVRGLQVRTDRGGPLDVIEGYYLAHIVHHFHRHGLLRRLTTPRTAGWLARRFRYEPSLLSALLEYVCERTDILRRVPGGRYRLPPPYADDYLLGFQIDKFIGAYGPVVERLEASLRRKTLGRAFVDRRREAEAYHRIQSPPNPVVLEVVSERKITSLVDLGCGPATLLTTLAAADRAFRGWGVDESSQMCRVARLRIRRAKLERQLRVVNADARSVGRLISPRQRREIEAVHCKGLLNELFRHGDRDAVAYVARLRRLFPARLLFVVEYYGKLTRARDVDPRYGHTLVHDLIQMLTGQGVPPPTLGAWADVYAKAGCALEHAYEGESHGIQWFVHLVRL